MTSTLPVDKWVCSHGCFFSERGTFVFRVPARGPQTEFLPGQLYFLTRLATLRPMTVIIDLVTLNLTTKTNCPQSPMTASVATSYLII